MTLDRYARSLLFCVVSSFTPLAGTAVLGAHADGRFLAIDSASVLLNGIGYCDSGRLINRTADSGSGGVGLGSHDVRRVRQREEVKWV